jgi:hypothetical protein
VKYSLFVVINRIKKNKEIIHNMKKKIIIENEKYTKKKR